ncbi:MAG: 2-hydroxyacyl-CoA dehydratase subunit D [Candidatus Omnitrophota bacterium]
MRPLRTQDQLKELLTGYYQRLGRRDSPVAWCTSVGPAELLRSFGFEVYFPENHGALIGARRLGATYIPWAGREGFSPDVCSYLTSDIGASFRGETPLEAYGLARVPAPDVLVYNTSQCRDVKEWFHFYAEKYRVPVLGIETPRGLDTLSPSLLAYLNAEWDRVIAGLEQVSGKRFNPDLLAAVVERSAQACRLWREFLESNRAAGPVSHTFFDQIILMAPVVVLRGTPEAVEFYRALAEEVTRSDRPQTPNRPYRLYWDGMPVWGKIRFLSELFSRLNAQVVTSTYCHSWSFDFDPSEPLTSAIRAYAQIFIARSESYKLDYLSDLCHRFAIDAVLFHDSKTCLTNTNNRYGIPDKLKEKTGRPYLVFFGDLVDMRHFSEQEFTLRLEAFLEQLR